MLTEVQGARGGPRGGQTKAGGCLDWGGGERRPLFHLCPGSLSPVRCSRRGEWLPPLPYPHPGLPGHRVGIPGHRGPGHRLGAVRLSAEPACVRGKVRGSCAWREVVPGAGGQGRGTLGRRAGGGVRSQRGSDAVGEALAGSPCPEARLRVTLGLSIWGQRSPENRGAAETGTGWRTEPRAAGGA